MTSRLFVATMVGSLICVVGASPVLAAGTDYYNPPKLIKQGTATSPVAGSGVVMVQVLVNPDGTFKVQKVVSSTNHNDDTAAMEMAQTAKYAPATKDGKKIAAFYTYRLKFVVGTSSASAPLSALATYTAEVHAGRYTDARTGLTAYLQNHPGDAQASVLLGVSDYFLNNYADSTAAFNSAGTIPSQYLSVAANAYAKAAQSAIANKSGAAAIEYATKAKQLDPGAPTWNLLGNAQVVQGDNAGAVQSFEQARTLAVSDSKMDAKERATITANLVAAYVNADEIDKAQSLLPEVKQLDSSNTIALSHVVNYYSKKGQAAQNSGNITGAVGWYEKGASLGGPEFGPIMYTNEAMAYMLAAHPDWHAVKAAADKALALKPDDARANLAEGLALSHVNSPKDAVPYLVKAESAAKAAGDTDAETKAHQMLTQLVGAGIGTK